jgi:putative aldouronate transport system substrate-binding protein
MLADITDYIENNASDTIKAVMDVNPETMETAKRNGRLYAMPKFGYGGYPIPNPLWLRHDWMQAAGASVPKTIAEMEKLMQTFMQAHPGTYGTGLDRDLKELYFLAPAFGAYPKIWVKGPDGKLVYSATQSGMKDAVATYADWYKKGYLKRDFVSMDNAAVRQDVISGKFGVHPGEQWWGFGYGPDLVSNQGKESYFEAFEIPSATGKPVLHPTLFDNEGYLVVNKNCKNIDAAIKCMSFIYYIYLDVISQKIMTPAQTLPYLSETVELLHVMLSFKINNSLDEQVQYDQVQEAVRLGTDAKMTAGSAISKYQAAQAWLNNGEVGGVGSWLQVYAANCAYTPNSKIVKEGRILYDAMMGPAPDDVISYGSTLDDLLKEGFTKIIIGTQPVSYFDTLVREWQNAGGNIVTAAVNREYGPK